MASPPDQLLFEDELLIIRHSGEIPEVALHGSIFFLTSDPHGPQFSLGPQQLRQMKEKVVERYLEMIGRDLEAENRDKSIYRGLARCIVNWQRMAEFCRREGFDLEPLKGLVSKLLISFIKNEILDVRMGRVSSLNCGRAPLRAFAEELDVEQGELPAGWQELCPEDP